MACLLLAVGCLNCNRRHAKDKGTGHGPAKTARAMAEGRRPRRCRLRSRARPLSRSVFVGRERLERVVGLPTLQTDHGETELVQAVKQDLPIRPSRKRCDDNLALSPTRRQSPLPSTPSCSRKPTRHRGRERKHRSRPSKYRGQQNSPCRVSSSEPSPIAIGLSARAPAHYPMLKNPELASRRKMASLRVRALLNLNEPMRGLRRSLARDRCCRLGP